jgi:predicted RNA-binding Zn ribbon-like protein
MGAYADKVRFEFDGGRPSLEFVNTVAGLRGVQPREQITGYADLAFWAEQLGLIDRRRMQELIGEAGRHPRKAAEALADAISARETLHEVLLAALEEREPPEAALNALNAWIAGAFQHRRLRPKAGGGYAADFDDDGSLLAFLRPVAEDAQRLLEGELARGLVRRCDESAVGRCGWFFVDETRNHSRRYCSMSDCGNRAKQRRYVQRQKES